MDLFFHPFVRFARRIAAHVPYPQPVCAFDHRLFFVLQGSFLLEIADMTHQMQPGDLAIFPPGTPYRLEDQPDRLPAYFILNFDFERVATTQVARHPIPADKFLREEIFSALSPEPFDKPILLHHAEILEPFLQEICREDVFPSSLSEEIKSSLLHHVLIKVVSLFQHTTQDYKTAAILRKAKKYIEQNISSPLNNLSVAETMGYHPYYLNFLFTKGEGTTLHKYIDNVRLRQAKEFLSSCELSIRDVALRCGFTDASYFARFFMKHTGLSPKDYRDLTR